MQPLTAERAKFKLPIGVGKERYVVSQVPNHANENDGRDDSKTRLALIDERPLTRAAILIMLQTRAPEFTISSFSSVTELLNGFANNYNELGLVLLSIGAANVSEQRVRECIEQLRQGLADVPVVVLSDCDDIVCIRQAFRYGVRGYFPTTLNPPVVIEGLRLVRAGGTFVPADVVLKGLEDQLSAAVEKHSNSAKPATLEELTPRQREVLECLQQAKSNKVIAFELQMQENTVKIHVRHILQKLKVTNRTHAALLACQMRGAQAPDRIAHSEDAQKRVKRLPTEILTE